LIIIYKYSQFFIRLYNIIHTSSLSLLNSFKTLRNTKTHNTSTLAHTTYITYTSYTPNMSHMQIQFVPRPICMPVPVSNQYLYVRVMLLNIHTTFVIQHGPRFDMMHEDSLTTYRKYISNNKSSSEHNSFHYFTCYYKTSTSFVIIRYYSTLYNVGYYFIIQSFTT